MAAYTSIMGFVQPASAETGWGDTINNYLTSYLDSSIGAATTITASTTLVRTAGTSLVNTGTTQSSQYPVIIATGAGPWTVTVGSSAITAGRPYIVWNNTSATLTFKAYGQTGVTLAVGEKAILMFSGTDYIKVGSTVALPAGSTTQVQYNSAGALAGSATFTFDGTTLTAPKLAGAYVPRVVSIADGASVTINSTTTDIATQINTQAVGTLTINAPTGTPYNGQRLIFRLQSTNIQTLSWASGTGGFQWSSDLGATQYSSGSSKYDYWGFMYNEQAGSGTGRWQVVAKVQGF
jgi:hypothetical protein